MYAKTDMSAGAAGISAFLVESGTEGFRCAQKLDKMVRDPMCMNTWTPHLTCSFVPIYAGIPWISTGGIGL